MCDLNVNTVTVEEDSNAVKNKMYEELNFTTLKKEQNIRFESVYFQIKTENLHSTDTKEEPESDEVKSEALFIKEEIDPHDGVVTSPLPNVNIETIISAEYSESELIITDGPHTQNLLECKHCGLRTTRKSYFKQHMNMHTKKRPFKCNKCDFQTAWKVSLKKHIMIHASNEMHFKYSKFDNDKFQWEHSFALERHGTTHDDQFNCDKCSSINGQTTSLCSCSMIDSSIDLPFKCDKCSYKTLWKRCLQPHMITHHGEKPFECEICGFKTAWPANVRQHMKTHTKGKFFMKCSKCNYRTTVKQNYEMHIPLHTE